MIRKFIPLIAVIAGYLALSTVSASAFYDYEGVTPTTIGTPCIAEPCMGGELRDPTGLAVNDQTGDMYVSDTGNHRVVRFSSAGAFESEITGTPTGPGNALVPFSSVGAVAVDNSESPSDPSAGDVYVIDSRLNVIDKFGPTGRYLGQITGTPSEPFVGVFSVAVDSEGEVWIYSRDLKGDGLVDRFSAALINGFNSQFVTGDIATSGPLPLAVDGRNVYLVAEKDGEIRELLVFTRTGLVAHHVNACGCVTGLAAGPSVGEFLASEGGSGVAMYDEAGNVLQTFGSESSGDAVVVNTSNGLAYVANEAGVIDAFTPSLQANVTTGAASAFTSSTVTLSGVVGPVGGEVTSCVFEYGAEATYGQSAPCSPNTPYQNEQAVTAVLPNVKRGKLYHYRLVADGHGGLDRTFLDPAPATIDSESALSVASESAELEAEVNPGGVEATYRFEYGTTTAYGSDAPTPDGRVEAAATDQPVATHLQGLQPGTVYHYRAVASGALGTVVGPDHAFTTPTASLGAVALLDGRAYELVSPPEKDGYQVETSTGSLTEGVDLPQASVDGTKVTYVTDGPVADPQGNGIGSQILSSRGPSGWSSQDISTPHQTPVGTAVDQGMEYRGFSADLSLGALEPFFNHGPSPEDPPLSPLAPTGYRILYLRDNVTGSFQSLLTLTNKSSIDLTAYDNMEFLDATPDFSHVVVTTNEKNLYEWSAGELQPVNVLPGGSETEKGILGGNMGPTQNSINAISDDGSRVIWTDAEGSGIYVRDTVTRTTTPVGSGLFRTASSDGSKIFFTVFNNGSETLYEYDLNRGVATDLTVDTNPADNDEAKVEGVLGASGDGSSVYFVAKGALQDREGRLLRNSDGGQPSSGAENLYLLHQQGEAWATSFVATLSEGDSSDWSFDPESHSSRVTPSGRYLAFGSVASLTGYDNGDARTGQPDEEMFVYDADMQRLTCASCNPTGARPIGSASIPGATSAHAQRAIYLPRNLSEEGRLFFDSNDALVPYDTDGTTDVYEWEPSGVGSCETAAGCPGLISSGTGANPSSFIDASTSGDDVFFITSDRLVQQDFDDSYDVYDAHVGSASVPCIATPAAQAPCASSDACRAGPLPQPGVFGAPPSATFSGAGNITPPAPVVKPKPKAKPRKCGKGYVKKKGRCVKRPKAKKSTHHGRGSR